MMVWYRQALKTFSHHCAYKMALLVVGASRDAITRAGGAG